MNFDFDINTLIPYEITKYYSDLRIHHPPFISFEQQASQLSRFDIRKTFFLKLINDFLTIFNFSRDMKIRLGLVIDRMGQASSKASFDFGFYLLNKKFCLLRILLHF
jgi:hypothetical protein